MNDIYTAAADGLKVLDLKRPIREADIVGFGHDVANVPVSDSCTAAI